MSEDIYDHEEAGAGSWAEAAVSYRHGLADEILAFSVEVPQEHIAEAARELASDVRDGDISIDAGERMLQNLRDASEEALAGWEWQVRWADLNFYEGAD